MFHCITIYSFVIFFFYPVHITFPIEKNKKQKKVFFFNGLESVEAKGYGFCCYAAYPLTLPYCPEAHVWCPGPLHPMWLPFICAVQNFKEYFWAEIYFAFRHIWAMTILQIIFTRCFSFYPIPSLIQANHELFFTSANHSGKIKYQEQYVQQPLKIPATVSFWVEFIDYVFGNVLLHTRQTASEAGNW